MPIIDAHTHAFPDTLAPIAVGRLVGREGVRSYYDGTVRGLLGSMELHGIERSVLAPVATKPSQVGSINDWIISIDDPRIVPLGSMHPNFPDPEAEIARLASHGVRGIKLHSQNQDFSPEESRMAPIYEAVSRHGMMILFHAGGFVIDEGTLARPHAFARMLDEWPDLVCVLAHMGGYRFWDEVCEHLCGRDVYFDTAYVPGNLPDDELLALIRGHGAGRVLFGSDGPWADAGRDAAHLGRIGLDAAELEQVLYGNARTLYCRGEAPPSRSETEAYNRCDPSPAEENMGSHILLVEDHPQNSYLMTYLLESRGYEVEAAADGAEALEAIERRAPGLILMDMQLPHVDGYEATRRIKADERFRDIPLVAVTAHSMRGDQDKAIAAGCDMYVTKPIDGEQLLALVEKLLPR
ncbi:MAG: amidohydrolase family protein [Coriobacteriia bacterium]|nr:amidohydrolase family protein [Coriobacteriia bacterium]